MEDIIKRLVGVDNRIVQLREKREKELNELKEKYEDELKKLIDRMEKEAVEESKSAYDKIVGDARLQVETIQREKQQVQDKLEEEYIKVRGDVIRQVISRIFGPMEKVS